MKVILEGKVAALVSAQAYASRDELLNDAVRALLRTQPQLRIISAVEMFRNCDISLARGAELGGLSLEDFKRALDEAGVRRAWTAPDAAELAAESRWLREAAA